MKTTLTTSTRHGLRVAVLSLAAALSSISLAESTDTVHLGTSAISKEEVIRLLAPETLPRIQTRGLRVHKKDEAPVYNGSEAPARKSLSMEVYFEFNSAQLTPEAVDQLSPVGEALSSEQLASLDFTFEGHTDATGDEYYNLMLSKQRAASVKRFFVEHFDMPGDRLKAEGKGEYELLAGTPPNSGVNRRVSIIAQ